MTQRILAVSSTPRVHGNSDILLDSIIAGARSTGAVVEKVRLAGLSIAGCRACNSCRKSGLSCAINDDMAPLLAKIRAADAYAFASPIYFFAVNAQMKVFLDRWYALLTEGWQTELRGRRAAVAVTYGADDEISSGARNAINMFADAFGFLGLEFSGCVQASAAAEGDVRRNERVLADADALGRRLGGQS